MNKHGIFCISIDFELYWGIHDKKSIEEYSENISGVWTVVPKLLELFKKYNIHATWAVLGAMISENLDELQEFTPTEKPEYHDKILSPYYKLYDKIKTLNPQYIFGKPLFETLKSAPDQEIGTHTFSHYYCLEDGQTKLSFEADLDAAKKILKKNGIDAKAFVFPRHQLNDDYIKDFPKFGIETYRGTEKIWYNSPAKTGTEGVLKRAVRFADYYFPMFSQHCQSISEVKQNENLYMIRASRWFRPYSEKWKKLDFLKLRRIKTQMKYAAKTGKIFQLWFHPHDIGKNIEENFRQLEIILKYFEVLKNRCNFQSKNFAEIKLICQSRNSNETLHS
ncbi:MAG: polysaccharide deacetylase family protein [Flavobacteriaceae bacterium]|jgi:peptidoglycan/xylan/chitin deacetylase (PgdA/CDA1 family)|nr:polysaccharide deacetylase family protein [Flavobacteriaceae bacterium]